MTTVFDVPPDKLIEKVKEKLKQNGKIFPPEWAKYVKTGMHRERAPRDPEWWYKRCASLLRRIYIDGPVGVSRLRTYYGGKKRRGVRPAHFVKGSGKILRVALQQLEDAGYVRKTPKGREITPEGRSFLDGVANEIKDERGGA